MPVSRSAEQAVFDAIVANWTADTEKYGQGTTDLKVRAIVRASPDQDLSRIAEPFVVCDLSYDERGPLGASGGHGMVRGRLLLYTRKDRSVVERDEIQQGLMTTLFGVAIDQSSSDWKLDMAYCVGGDVRTSDASSGRVVTAYSFQCFVAHVGVEGVQLHGRRARLEWTAGSGGVTILFGQVNTFDHGVSRPMVDATDDANPDIELVWPGASKSSWSLRMAVTSAVQGSGTSANPRIPDGVLASLKLYKAGQSGQSWTEPVYVTSMEHSADRSGGQYVTYRLVRSGVTTEVLS